MYFEIRPGVRTGGDQKSTTPRENTWPKHWFGQLRLDFQKFQAWPHHSIHLNLQREYEANQSSERLLDAYMEPVTLNISNESRVDRGSAFSKKLFSEDD